MKSNWALGMVKAPQRFFGHGDMSGRRNLIQLPWMFLLQCLVLWYIKEWFKLREKHSISICIHSKFKHINCWELVGKTFNSDWKLEAAMLDEFCDDRVFTAQHFWEHFREKQSIPTYPFQIWINWLLRMSRYLSSWYRDYTGLYFHQG